MNKFNKILPSMFGQSIDQIADPKGFWDTISMILKD
jgi:hypothetical protein